MPSPSNTLFGQVEPQRPTRRCPFAPRQLVLLIERWAQSAQLCMPELCERFSGGRTCVATQLTHDEAVKLEHELRARVRTMLRARDNPKVKEDRHATPNPS